MQSDAFSLKGRVALVTGCGTANGIGFACASLLSSQGLAAIAITSTTAERTNARAEELRALGHQNVLALVGDLSDFGAALSIEQQVVDAFGRLDIVVNNSGMCQSGLASEAGTLHSQGIAEFERSIRISLMTAVHTTKAAIPHLRKNRYGRIVNIGSVTGPLVSSPGSAAYSVAKAGMDRSVAIEEARYGITINSILPGWIQTDSSEDHEKASSFPIHEYYKVPSSISLALVCFFKLILSVVAALLLLLLLLVPAATTDLW